MASLRVFASKATASSRGSSASTRATFSTTQSAGGGVERSEGFITGKDRRREYNRYSSSMQQGSTGNVIAALASFCLPGLGQPLQGRALAALLFFLLFGALWAVWLGPIVHVVACFEAAIYKGKISTSL